MNKPFTTLVEMFEQLQRSTLSSHNYEGHVQSYSGQTIRSIHHMLISIRNTPPRTHTPHTHPTPTQSPLHTPQSIKTNIYTTEKAKWRKRRTGMRIIQSINQYNV